MQSVERRRSKVHSLATVLLAVAVPIGVATLALSLSAPGDSGAPHAELNNERGDAPTRKPRLGDDRRSTGELVDAERSQNTALNDDSTVTLEIRLQARVETAPVLCQCLVVSDGALSVVASVAAALKDGDRIAVPVTSGVTLVEVLVEGLVGAFGYIAFSTGGHTCARDADGITGVLGQLHLVAQMEKGHLLAPMAVQRLTATDALVVPIVEPATIALQCSTTDGEPLPCPSLQLDLVFDGVQRPFSLLAGDRPYTPPPYSDEGSRVSVVPNAQIGITPYRLHRSAMPLEKRHTQVVLDAGEVYALNVVIENVFVSHVVVVDRAGSEIRGASLRPVSANAESSSFLYSSETETWCVISPRPAPMFWASGPLHERHEFVLQYAPSDSPQRVRLDACGIQVPGQVDTAGTDVLPGDVEVAVTRRAIVSDPALGRVAVTIGEYSLTPDETGRFVVGLGLDDQVTVTPLHHSLTFHPWNAIAAPSKNSLPLFVATALLQLHIELVDANGNLTTEAGSIYITGDEESAASLAHGASPQTLEFDALTQWPLQMRLPRGGYYLRALTRSGAYATTDTSLNADGALARLQLGPRPDFVLCEVHGRSAEELSGAVIVAGTRPSFQELGTVLAWSARVTRRGKVLDEAKPERVLGRLLTGFGRFQCPVIDGFVLLPVADVEAWNIVIPERGVFWVTVDYSRQIADVLESHDQVLIRGRVTPLTATSPDYVVTVRNRYSAEQTGAVSNADYTIPIDANGEFSLSVPAGWYDLRVKRANTFTAGPRTEVRVVADSPAPEVLLEAPE